MGGIDTFFEYMDCIKMFLQSLLQLQIKGIQNGDDIEKLNERHLRVSADWCINMLKNMTIYSIHVAIEPRLQEVYFTLLHIHFFF